MLKRILCSFACMFMLAQPALADSQDAVIDDDNNYVTNSFGNCVRTKWMKDSDPCAPPPPPAPEPVVEVVPEPEPEPVEMVSQEERTVYFGFDSSKVEEAEVQKLISLSEAINASKSVSNVRIVGYTDPIGATAYNEKLSNQRAQAVVDLLTPMLAVEVQKDELQVRGAGEMNDASCEAIKAYKERKECYGKERKVEVQLDRTFMELR